MIRRGCAVSLLVFAGLFAAYFVFFTKYFEWPGNLIAAFLGSLFAAVAAGGVGHLLWGRRDAAAFARASREAPADGQLVAVAGPIRPMGAPLTSPLGGKSCVAYEYEVYAEERGPRGRTVKTYDLTGVALAASAIDTPHGSVRLLGFPMLDEFPQARMDDDASRRRAEQFAATSQFEPMTGGTKAFKMLAAFDDALIDADGIVRKDFRLTDGGIPFDRRFLRERIVKVGEQVCALGLYDASKRALVPRGQTLNRLWPGTAEQTRRRIGATARSQAITSFVFFAISHAMLGLAWYMSETRHARLSEEEQAQVIQLAIQDGEVTALERAVRRGANPNARYASGFAPFLDVRDARWAEAMIRVGADVELRDRDTGDTLLIRAARYGDAEMVRVLLAARANVNARTSTGQTALAEALAEGHTEVANLLRAAGAISGDPIVELPPAGEKRP